MMIRPLLILSLVLLTLGALPQAGAERMEYHPVFHARTEIAQAEAIVMFNTSSFKFHVPTCKWALKCTRNCIRITRQEAVRRGGIPCKVCGGGVRW